MSERKQGESTASVFRSKPVVIALVAAAALILGAMSVGAAVMIYKKLPRTASSQPASANPFTNASNHNGRHTSGENSPGSEPQVAGANTASASVASGSKPQQTPPSPSPATPSFTVTPPPINVGVESPVLDFEIHAQPPVADPVLPIQPLLKNLPPPVDHVQNIVNNATGALGLGGLHL